MSREEQGIGTASEAQQGQQSAEAKPFVDTPVLAARRRAFDNPSIANLDALIQEAAEARASQLQQEAEYRKHTPDCAGWQANHLDLRLCNCSSPLLRLQQERDTAVAENRVFRQQIEHRARLFGEAVKRAEKAEQERDEWKRLAEQSSEKHRSIHAKHAASAQARDTLTQKITTLIAQWRTPDGLRLTNGTSATFERCADELEEIGIKNAENNKVG